jgi:hypothetical protein
MISTGWYAVINEYVGAARAPRSGTFTTVRKFVPGRNRARQKAIL